MLLRCSEEETDEVVEETAEIVVSEEETDETVATLSLPLQSSRALLAALEEPAEDLAQASGRQTATSRRNVCAPQPTCRLPLAEQTD
mmetsp:Transcript_22943/g.40334  ORF Transcript_22943/g.40334 Transcript_22943/m.40334 type:complete len:87 (+) Transcript_22943:29-289(+)